MIQVLHTDIWIFSQNSCRTGGQVGQITACKFEQTVFYTRENINGIDSFFISSGERMGDKTDKVPRKERQVLELVAPDDKWNDIAAIVYNLDPLKRKVIKNEHFNINWIKTNGYAYNTHTS